MFSEKQPVGFNITLIGVVDREHNDQVQISGDAPRGASATELAATLSLMSTALWTARVEVNNRLLAKSEAIKHASAARVQEFRDRGEPIDEDMINDHVSALNSTIVRQQAESDVGRALVNGGPDGA